jgi:hypothetical protein
LLKSKDVFCKFHGNNYKAKIYNRHTKNKKQGMKTLQKRSTTKEDYKRRKKGTKMKLEKVTKC